MGAGFQMATEAIRVQAITLVAGGYPTARVAIKVLGTTLVVVGHQMAERGIREQAITLAGATVRTAMADFKGQDGVNKAAAEQPDVILLDMMMPIMDGPSTLEALRSNDRTRNIPVIFLTAKAMTSEIERLKRMGARGILTKPFDPTVLATQMKAILDTTS